MNDDVYLGRRGRCSGRCVRTRWRPGTCTRPSPAGRLCLCITGTLNHYQSLLRKCLTWKKNQSIIIDEKINKTVEDKIVWSERFVRRGTWYIGNDRLIIYTPINKCQRGCNGGIDWCSRGNTYDDFRIKRFFIQFRIKCLKRLVIC